MRRRRAFAHAPERLLTAAVGALLLLGAPSIASADEPAGGALTGWAIPTVPGPPQFTHGAATAFAKHNLSAAPAGSNNFDCRPTARHPRPVVLAHGTDSNAYSDWAELSPILAADGYCVFALNYGGNAAPTTYGTEDMARSGRQVAMFVDQVLAATHARQVDLIGYSQGATVTRYYMNRLGGAQNVHRWIGIASPTYGGVMYGTVPVAQSIPGAADALSNVLPTAVLQQMQGSAFLTALNAGGDTVPGPRYTTVASVVDEMIQPSSNIALRDPGATNLVVQDLCPSDMTGHFNMVYDAFTLQLVQNALDPESAKVPTCEFVPLGTGIPEVIGSSHS